MKRLALVAVMVFAVSGIALASVTITADRNYIDFRSLDNGQTRELSDQGVYHNQITCTSTNNRTWYLKVNTLRPFTAGANTIPNENFKWMVVDVVNGQGIVYNNKNIPTPFMDTRGLVYTSDPLDNNGTQVTLQFRYILTIPKNQAAGNYVSYIRWTITEQL